LTVPGAHQRPRERRATNRSDKLKLPGAAEDPALLFYAGLRRETPDRPEPGVPQVFSEGTPRWDGVASVGKATAVRT